MLLSKDKERESNPPPPLGNEKKSLVRITKNTPSQEQHDFAPKGIALICNHQLNALGGEQDLKFKREIKV